MTQPPEQRPGEHGPDDVEMPRPRRATEPPAPWSESTDARVAQDDPADQGDLLEEVRILQQGAQTLTAFLIVVPFNAGFAKVGPLERWVYLGTFLSAVASLVCLSAPAAQHRLERPLVDRARFKDAATRVVLAGLACLSVALVLASLLVVTEVLGSVSGRVVALVVGLGIGILWWAVPVWRRNHRRDDPARGKA